MPPFTHKHCPCCSTDTTQHYLLRDGELLDAESEWQAVCASCETVLIYRADGAVGQRAATTEEREVLPPRIDLSTEPWVAIRAEIRQGMAELNAWIHAGCPGLTREMLNGFSPSAAAALARRGIRVPDADQPAHEEEIGSRDPEAR